MVGSVSPIQTIELAYCAWVKPTSDFDTVTRWALRRLLVACQVVQRHFAIAGVCRCGGLWPCATAVRVRQVGMDSADVLAALLGTTVMIDASRSKVFPSETSGRRKCFAFWQKDVYGVLR